MIVHLLKSKIHRARVTASSLDYEGSLTIDAALMAKVGLLPYEKILCGDLNNGNRWESTITLPNTPCDNCVLQLIQDMGGDTANPVGDLPNTHDLYFQCADIVILAAGEGEGEGEGDVGEGEGDVGEGEGEGEEGEGEGEGEEGEGEGEGEEGEGEEGEGEEGEGEGDVDTCDGCAATSTSMPLLGLALLLLQRRRRR